MQRVHEWLAARSIAGRTVFTSSASFLPSAEVRGRQMAEVMKGRFVRSDLLPARTISKATSLIWVRGASETLLKQFQGRVPQIFDLILAPEDASVWEWRLNAMDGLILNTESMRDYLGKLRPNLKTFVIPHHHCNLTYYVVPEERVEKPLVAGYIGEPEHLHDRETIAQTIESLGWKFLICPATDLASYQTFDVGIAWTRPEEMRQRTRSNIKFLNFAAHGIPSVVPDYESYRNVDAVLGGNSCFFAKDLDDYLAKLRDLASDGEARRTMNAKASAAQAAYSREAIAEKYREMLTSIAT